MFDFVKVTQLFSLIMPEMLIWSRITTAQLNAFESPELLSTSSCGRLWISVTNFVLCIWNSITCMVSFESSNTQRELTRSTNVHKRHDELVRIHPLDQNLRLAFCVSLFIAEGCARWRLCDFSSIDLVSSKHITNCLTTLRRSQTPTILIRRL